MTDKEFIEALKNAVACQTIYVKGGFGLTLNAKGKQRAINSYAYNKKREKKINDMPDNSFGFDCCGLVKGVYWGFNGDPKKVYGGATYKSGCLDDVSEIGLLSLCTDISNDFDNIIPGELVYLKGHCGVYIGNGEVIESTPIWEDGAQITRLAQRKWLKHGKLSFITYTQDQTNKPYIARPTLRNGSRGLQVEYLQKDLNYLGASLDPDGIFGPLTKKALMDFQRSQHIGIDGIYGPESYRTMRGKIL